MKNIKSIAAAITLCALSAGQAEAIPCPNPFVGPFTGGIECAGVTIVGGTTFLQLGDFTDADFTEASLTGGISSFQVVNFTIVNFIK